jgi:hypothetical protein
MINLYFGTYGDSVVFSFYSGGGRADIYSFYLAGYRFTFGSSSRIMYLWNNGEVYRIRDESHIINGERIPLPNVYELGLLTQEQVGELHAIYWQVFRGEHVWQ